MLRAALLFIAAALAARAAAARAPTGAALGFIFTSEGWTHPSANYSSSGARESLAALAATGANTVSLRATAYVDGPASVAVHGVAGDVPLRTTSPAELQSVVALAASLNLSVVIDCFLDLFWASPSLLNHHADTSRSAIAAGLAPDDPLWDELFSSWAAWLLPLAAAANASAAPGARAPGARCAAPAAMGPGVVAFSIGSELDGVWREEARMRALVASVRAAYAGCVTAAFTGASLGSVAWLDALDVIGVDAFWSLGASALPLGREPAVADLVAGWASALAVMSGVAARVGRPVLVTATGAQSRPNCFLAPWGTGRPGAGDGNDQGDMSAYVCAYDAPCQGAVYASALRALLPHAAAGGGGGWLAGVLFWRWSADATAGGPSDSDFTPHGKVAEAVFRNATGALPPGCAVELTPGGALAVAGPSARAGEPSACDGSAAVAAAVAAEGARRVAAGAAAGAAAAAARASAAAASAASAGAPPPVGAPPFTGFRGFVYGMEEWSSPDYRLDSPGAQSSLANIAALGGNSVELVIQWFFGNVTDTFADPITDPASPMRTSTDAEITSFVVSAKKLGLKVIFSPMLDPRWTDPAQLGCRDNHDDPACFWRGQIGYFWPDAPSTCTPATSPEWAAWHAWYSDTFILPYARLAAATGMDGLVLAHELDRPVQNCPDRWTALLAAVRGVYSGPLSIAQGSGIVFGAAPATLAWIKTLDYVGIECYQGSMAQAPDFPWQDAPLADMQAGLAKTLGGFADFYAATGLKLACTEGGWLAAPWAGEDGWGSLLDPADTTVWTLDTNGASQARAYTAFLSVFEAQPWYAGGWYWFWRADPTAGGTSDPSPVPWAKEATQAIAALWLG